MKKLLVLFLLVSSFAQIRAEDEAQPEKKIDNSLETRLANFRIDENFRAGEYLIYDCGKKAFTCVDENSFDTCKLRREESRDKNRRVLLCAPLKKFSNRESCLLYNYELIQKAHTEKFCYRK